MKQLKLIAKHDNDYALMKRALEDKINAKDIPPDHPARPYKADWNLLAINQDLITIGDRILVPKGARKDILKGLHLSHLGLKKTASLAKTLYYWKNMTKEIDIEELELLKEMTGEIQRDPSMTSLNKVSQMLKEEGSDLTMQDIMIVNDIVNVMGPKVTDNALEIISVISKKAGNAKGKTE